jgi:hypothetical protein
MADQNTRVELTPSALDSEAIDRLTNVSRLVLKSFPASPAYKLGISSGWRLLRISGGPPTDNAMQQAELETKINCLFADPSGDQAYMLKDAPWPFGMLTVPWPGQEFYNQITSGDSDGEDLVKYWQEGILTPYAQFAKPIEQYLSHDFQWFWEGWLGKVAQPEKLALHEDLHVLMLLALSKAVAANFDEAQFYFQASRASRIRANQANYARIDRSLDAYVESMLAEHSGNMEKALSSIEAAVPLKPDCSYKA